MKGSRLCWRRTGTATVVMREFLLSTGLPTVLGWYVHEWLWRNDVPDLNEKSADIESIYTSADEEYVKELLEDMMFLIFL